MLEDQLEKYNQARSWWKTDWGIHILTLRVSNNTLAFYVKHNGLFSKIDWNDMDIWSEYCSNLKNSAEIIIEDTLSLGADYRKICKVTLLKLN